MQSVRVGVVGIGNMGVHHARVYSQLPQTELVGIVDIHEDRGRQCSELYRTRYFESYTELFDKVDAVNIVVPTSLHYPLAMEFLERGVHVLVEKPITVEVAQAKRLVECAKRGNLVLQVGHLERFNPAVIKLREVKGQPIHMECHRLSCPTRRNLDVGVVWDLMIHDLDILIHLVDSPVVEICAMGVSVYSDHEDVAQVQLRFENGVVASLLASRISGEKLRRLKVTEDTGRTLKLDFIDQTLAALRPGLDGHPLPPEVVPVEKDEPLLLELTHFAECVATHKTPLVTGEDGKRALELAMSVLASMTVVKPQGSAGQRMIALAG